MQENRTAVESAIVHTEEFPFIPRLDIEVKNRNILLDTLNVLKSDDKLSNIVEESSKNNLYYTGKFAYGDLEKYEEEAKVFVSKRSTFEAATSYDGKVCALNFANFFTPGGGVTYGSTAQEECLCRTSSLLCNLITKESFEKFYSPHKDIGDDLANDDVIYSPDVVVVKADNYDLLETPKIVNVITCAAPDLRKIELTDEDLYEIHYMRGIQILKVAAANGNEHVVLGAFGCGVFANDPEVVADAYRDLIDGYFRHTFKTIEFAVYCPGPKDSKNYEAFNKYFNKTYNMQEEHVNPDDLLKDVRVEVTENEEYKGMKDRADKIASEEGDVLDISAYKRYIALYNITVFLAENGETKIVPLEGASCIYLCKNDDVAKIMALNELCKQSQYEFVAICDAELITIRCVDDGNRIVYQK